MLSADEGWENRNARQSRPQPNRMLQGSNLLRSVTSSIPMWQLLPSDRTYPKIDCEISPSIFVSEGVLV